MGNLELELNTANSDYNDLHSRVYINDTISMPIIAINQEYKIKYYNENAKKEFNLDEKEEFAEIFKYKPDFYGQSNSLFKITYLKRQYNVLISTFYGTNRSDSIKLLFFVDFSAHISIYDRLSELENNYALLSEHSSDIILFIDLTGTIRYSSKSVETTLEYLTNDLFGMNIQDILDKDSFEPTKKRIKNIIDGCDTNSPYIVLFHSKNGSVIPFELNTTPMMKNGKIDGIQIVARNISERMRYQKRLDSLYYHTNQLSKAKTIKEIAKMTLESVEQILGYIDCGFGIVDNGALLYILSKSEEFHEKTYSIDEPLPQIYAITTGTLQLDSIGASNSDMNSITIHVPVIVDNHVVALISIKSRYKYALLNEDIKLLETLALNVASSIDRLCYLMNLESMIKKISLELEQAQRLATIGETAAMVGHDLRNPLQVLVGSVDIMKSLIKKNINSPSLKNDLLKWLNKLCEQSEYMNKIVSDLQDYARNIKLDYIETDLTILFDKTLKNMNIPENIIITKKYKANVPTIFVDQESIQRCMTNLFTNSIQAMPEGGTLTIILSYVSPYHLIEVCDTGIGIPEENLEKIFKPLFTTKSKGTGFGLPVCKRIIEAHRGQILINSIQNNGTNIVISIPNNVEIKTLSN